MIKVKAVIPDGKFESLRVKGHADFAPHGQDLVCAAVSAIVTGGINALKHPDSFNIFQDTGITVIKLKPKEDITNYDATVINVILDQLETIEQSYGDFIKMSYNSERQIK